MICKLKNILHKIIIPVCLLPLVMYSLCGNDPEPPAVWSDTSYIAGGTLEKPTKISRISMPIRGNVDKSRESYYAITGLTPGNTYSVIITKMQSNVDLYVYDSDETFTTVICRSTNSDTSEEGCNFAASGAAAFIKITEQSTTEYYSGLSFTIVVE